jgi:hypothetical protein
MGNCNCKNGNKIDDMLQKDSNGDKKINIGKYVLKSFVFLIALAASPIIMMFIIWIMFKMLVLNENIDFKPLLMAIGNKFKREEKEYDDDDDITLYDEKDLIPLEVEEIK